MPFSDCLSFNQSRDHSLPNLASRRRRRRRIIIIDTAANIASLSTVTPTKNRAWPEQYEVTPIDVRRTCTPYMYAVHVQRRTCTSHMHDVHVRQYKHSSHMYDIHVQRTCMPYMCDECLHYHTCTPYTCSAYMYAVHVRQCKHRFSHVLWRSFFVCVVQPI